MMSSVTETLPRGSDAALNAPPLDMRRLRKKRGSGNSLAAHGEPMVWLTGGALTLALVMIIALLGFVIWQGTVTFWPVPLVHVELADGTLLMGEPTRDETFKLEEAAIDRLAPGLQESARKAMAESAGVIHRRLLRTGNFDLTGTHFHWVDDYAVTKETRPEFAMVVERVEKGRFYGIPQSMIAAGEPVAEVADENDADEARRTIWDAYQQHHDAVTARREEIERLLKHEIGHEAARQANARLEMRAAELKHGPNSPEHQEAKKTFEAVLVEVGERTGEIRARAEKLRAENARFSITLATAQGVEKTLGMDEIVRMYPANRLSTGDKWSLYFSRWHEFFFDDPREANSEGGVWPAIVGTLTMTLAMALAVVPFGVLAALYLREYAKSGPITSAVRIAINNLAGVPSIVFGVFGLGFFCYVCGASIDQIFYPASVADNNPVFGKGALVWASLTLALLTLPVVIVASEEALAAVPNSMREGSYACGGSKWQTIRRIVLPHAMPGIMTGTILAMARGAGEVAPLMLVGAVKLAPELPVNLADWSGSMGPIPTGPLHLDNSFMHLGFHIFDLGFQSQNSEAAKPMVFTTTLLLIGLVAGLNVTAIWLRGRLRRRFVTGGF
ncbi:MAG: phosphate ABC transporter permease PstA [Planctomycetales bacterium]|nr:phosphate ABC transporter permease PstA [Planctomycetales bacterium]